MNFYPSKAITLLALFTALIPTYGTEKLNILLITVDDLNTDIGVLGGPALTPNIDQLARDGVLFTDAHCSVPVCNASRVSFMTGLQANTTEVYANHPNFRSTANGKDAVTIPQYFAAHGYKTAAVGKIFHNGRGNKTRPKPLSDPQSWQYQHPSQLGVPYETPQDNTQLWHKGKLGESGKYWPARAFIWEAVDIEDEDTYDWQNADFCAQFLQEAHEKPFFLACGIFRPHVPFTAPQKYFDLYPIENIERPPLIKNDLNDLSKIGIEWARKSDLHKWITRFNQWEKAIQGYLASTSYADAAIGHLLDALEKSSYRDNTIVVLLSDHGFHLGSKEHWAKFTFWDRSTRVPLIIKTPNGTKATYKDTVSLIDVYPTLVDLAGLPHKPELEGESLVPQIENPNTPINRPARVLFLGTGNEAIITKNWRYIRYHDGSEELYDRQKDPHDWYNLVQTNRLKTPLNHFRSQRIFK